MFDWGLYGSARTILAHVIPRPTWRLFPGPACGVPKNTSEWLINSNGVFSKSHRNGNQFTLTHVASFNPLYSGFAHAFTRAYYLINTSS
jgi:hypothetical protein